MRVERGPNSRHPFYANVLILHDLCNTWATPKEEIIFGEPIRTLDVHKSYPIERRKGPLAITRKKKEELVATYKEQIANSSAIVFTDFRGISVSQVQSLRAKLGENDAQYMVVKNSLFELALSETGENGLTEKLGGPNGVLFLSEDIGKGVTALKDWIKSAQVVTITGGLLEGSLLNQTQAEALADLPTKEETLSMILGAISAPSGKLVRTINAPAASLARVINARVEKMKEEAA